MRCNELLAEDGHWLLAGLFFLTWVCVYMALGFFSSSMIADLQVSR